MTKNDLIQELGSPADLARAAGVSPQAVSQWDGERLIPLHSAIKVAKSTGHKLHELRPDLFDPDEQIPEFLQCAGIESAEGDAA